LKEAAVALGISKDAVRQRVRRGTLESDKGEDGRVYVYLHPSVYECMDASADAVHREGGRDPDVVDELRDRVRYLERQVEEERDARRRADTLLARLMDRVPELEPPAEAPPHERDAPETAQQEPERAEPRPDAPGPHEGVQRRPWWRRMFGG